MIMMVEWNFFRVLVQLKLPNYNHEVLSFESRKNPWSLSGNHLGSCKSSPIPTEKRQVCQEVLTLTNHF